MSQGTHEQLFGAPQETYWRCTMKKVIAATTMLASVLVACVPAYAASITTWEPNWNWRKGISIKGEITLEDLDTFKNMIAKFIAGSKVIVALNSTGGKVDAGWGIGQIVHDRGHETYAWGDMCNSVCADLWLAGSVRYLNEGTKVGFYRGFITVKDSMGNNIRKSAPTTDKATVQHYYASELKLLIRMELAFSLDAQEPVIDFAPRRKCMRIFIRGDFNPEVQHLEGGV
jgi:hypothetical protein